MIGQYFCKRGNGSHHASGGSASGVDHSLARTARRGASKLFFSFLIRKTSSTQHSSHEVTSDNPGDAVSHARAQREEQQNMVSAQSLELYCVLFLKKMSE